MLPSEEKTYVELFTKYNNLLVEHKKTLIRYNAILNRYSNILNSVCDYMEEIQLSKKWWWISKNITIENRLLKILKSRELD